MSAPLLIASLLGFALALRARAGSRCSSAGGAVGVAAEYLRLSNAHNLKGMLRLYRADVSLYGVEATDGGMAAVGAAQSAFYVRHGPSLRYEWGELRELQHSASAEAGRGGELLSVVEFPFSRHWGGSGAAQRWDSLEHGLVERIHVGLRSGRIARVELVAAGSGADSTAAC